MKPNSLPPTQPLFIPPSFSPFYNCNPNGGPSLNICMLVCFFFFVFQFFLTSLLLFASGYSLKLVWSPEFKDIGLKIYQNKGPKIKRNKINDPLKLAFQRRGLHKFIGSCIQSLASFFFFLFVDPIVEKWGLSILHQIFSQLKIYRN